MLLSGREDYARYWELTRHTYDVRSLQTLLADSIVTCYRSRSDSPAHPHWPHCPEDAPTAGHHYNRVTHAISAHYTYICHNLPFSFFNRN